MHNNNQNLGIVLAFAAIFLIWGTTNLAIALTVRTLPPFLSGGLRFIAAGSLLYAWLRRHELRPFEGIDWRHAALCGVLMTGIGNGLVMWAQRGLPSGTAAVLLASLPIFILSFDWLFFSKRAPSLTAVLGIAVALIGVVSIALDSRDLASSQPIYVIATLVAVFSWATGTLLQKKVASGYRVLNFTCMQMIAGGLSQCFMSIFNPAWQTFDPEGISYLSIAAVLYLILFSSIVALSCYQWLLNRVPAQKVTTYALVNPVIAVMMGALLLDEPITSSTAFAAMLVLVGVALVLFQRGADRMESR